jgi:hypothetical protein
MIAISILSGALTWLVLGMSRNIRAENTAKLMATASFLARQQLVEFEDELYLKGFSEFDNNPECKFNDEKDFTRFTCKILVEKVELPNADQIQTVLTKAQDAKNTLNGNPSTPPATNNLSTLAANNPMSTGAGALASQYGIIKDVQEQGIRRVTVSVVWKEGRIDRSVDLVTYYTDVRKVDQAIQIAASPQGAGGPTGSTSGGTSGGSTTSSGGASH